MPTSPDLETLGPHTAAAGDGAHARAALALAEPKPWFAHPRGLATLFFTEMWERFSYYALCPILLGGLTAEEKERVAVLVVPIRRMMRGRNPAP